MAQFEVGKQIHTLIVPGLHDSGGGHWQSWWQAVIPGTQRVRQDDWRTPDLDAWSERLLQSVARQPEAVWLVAHSFGCLAAVHAVSQCAHNIAGVFLVAAADPDRFGLVDRLPLRALPVPTAQVVSSDDPWLLESKALWLAKRWGSEVFPIGAAGHVNTASGFGPWVEGLVLFRDFVRQTTGIEVTERRLLAEFPILRSVHPPTVLVAR
ncbi:MAG: alpha/beta fold hydrolase [Rugosibacter sp.]